MQKIMDATGRADEADARQDKRMAGENISAGWIRIDCTCGGFRFIREETLRFLGNTLGFSTLCDRCLIHLVEDGQGPQQEIIEDTRRAIIHQNFLCDELEGRPTYRTCILRHRRANFQHEMYTGCRECPRGRAHDILFGHLVRKKMTRISKVRMLWQGTPLDMEGLIEELLDMESEDENTSAPETGEDGEVCP